MQKHLMTLFVSLVVLLLSSSQGQAWGIVPLESIDPGWIPIDFQTCDMGEYAGTPFVLLVDETTETGQVIQIRSPSDILIEPLPLAGEPRSLMFDAAGNPVVFLKTDHSTVLLRRSTGGEWDTIFSIELTDVMSVFMDHTQNEWILMRTVVENYDDQSVIYSWDQVLYAIRLNAKTFSIVSASVIWSIHNTQWIVPPYCFDYGCFLQSYPSIRVSYFEYGDIDSSSYIYKIPRLDYEAYNRGIEVTIDEKPGIGWICAVTEQNDRECEVFPSVSITKSLRLAASECLDVSIVDENKAIVANYASGLITVYQLDDQWGDAERIDMDNVQKLMVSGASDDTHLFFKTGSCCYYAKRSESPPTPTPAPEPCVRIDLPAQIKPDYVFHVKGFLDNPSTDIIHASVVFFLDVYGQYWFWDDWTHFDPESATGFDFVRMDVPPGTTEIDVVPSCVFPDLGPVPIEGLRFWGAMLSPDVSTILGSHAMAEWGYSP